MAGSPSKAKIRPTIGRGSLSAWEHAWSGGARRCAVPGVKFALGVPVAMVFDLALFALLRRASPRPFGLITTPPLTPAMLSSAGQSNLRTFSHVVLCYGRPL